MKIERTFLRSTRFIILMSAFMALGLALVGVSARSSKKPAAPQASQQIQVRNYTNAFEVVATETVGEMYVVSLKNVSQKAISAYSRSLGPSNRPTNIRDTDGAVSGQVIEPGAIHREEVPLIAFVHSAETTPTHEAIINFVAVLFDDRSGDGVPEAVQVLKDRRTGERTQLKRIKRLLNGAVTTEGSKSQATLNDLKASISALPESVDEGESFAIEDGLLSAKRHALVTLDHLMNEHGGIEMLRGPNRSEGVKRILFGLMEQTDGWLSRY